MKTVFMDLQGTLGGDPLGDISSFSFFPRALDGLKLLQEKGYRLVVVTNQSRIAKGLLTVEAFHEKKDAVIEEAKNFDVDLSDFYFCPHAKNDGCLCKKPKTGLYEQALADAHICLEKSYMVGDMGLSDMLFAHRLGLKKILVLTGVGEGSCTSYRKTWKETEPEFVARDFYEAACWICGK